MNRENVAKWADELQFGGHKKTVGFLHHNGGHCAIGVADVMLPRHDGHIKSWSVARWLDLDDNQVRQITCMNDDNPEMTLPEIGAWIRDNWLKEE